jgi:hypothetical protein
LSQSPISLSQKRSQRTSTESQYYQATLETTTTTQYSSITNSAIASQQNQTIIAARSISNKYPSTNINYDQLLEVRGRNGNNYFIYWDERCLPLDSSYKNGKHKDNMLNLKKIFDNKEEVKGGGGSAGIKALTPLICIKTSGFIFSHEIKSLDTRSRVYGFIQKTNIGFVVIFCHFDPKGKLTGH